MTPPIDPPAARMPRVTLRARGTALLVVSALAFSAAGLLSREAGVSVWSMVVWRNLFGGAAPLALILARGGAPWRDLAALGRWGWATVVASSTATLFYLAAFAFAFTSVADVAVIYAASPLATALLARVWLGKRLDLRMLAGALLALCGVAITLAGSVGSGTVFGDGLALAMTLAMALTTVLARKAPRLPALPMACLATLPTVVLEQHPVYRMSLQL